MIRITLLIAFLPIVVQSKAQRNEYFCLMGSARQSYDKKTTNDSVYPKAVYDKPGQAVNFKMSRFLTGLSESTKEGKSGRKEFYRSLPDLKRVPLYMKKSDRDQFIRLKSILQKCIPSSSKHAQLE